MIPKDAQTLSQRRSSCLWFQIVGVETYLLLPDDQSDRGNLPGQGQACHGGLRLKFLPSAGVPDLWIGLWRRAERLKAKWQSCSTSAVKCVSCGYVNVEEFESEITIHFPQLKKLW
jgi:hypothetical protein